MFRLIRISLSTSLLADRIFSLKGRLLRSYSQWASSRLAVTVSSAANSPSPLKLYGFVTSL